MPKHHSLLLLLFKWFVHNNIMVGSSSNSIEFVITFGIIFLNDFFAFFLTILFPNAFI
jgi:hypothetical protein